MIAGAAVAYGVAEGGAYAERIDLTSLARRIVAPTVEGDDIAAKREALLQPRVIREFLRRYNGSSLPAARIAENVLEELGVPAARTERTFQLIVQSAEALGLLRMINGKAYVELDASPTSDEPAGFEPDGDDLGSPDFSAGDDANRNGDAEPSDLAVALTKPRPIFVGGRKGPSLDQLTKILEEYDLPYRLAEDEANRGRPISQKVAETIRECGAAIIVFTPDEQYFDAEGRPVWKPSENVVHELGAASMQFGHRIVIFREESVTLAVNYSDIGHIVFSKDQLAAKGIELFRELIAFGLVKVMVGV